MSYMIWAGAALTLLGVMGLIYCIVVAMRARSAALPEDQMKVVLQRVVVWNMGALALSGLGLMAVVLGVMLG